MTAPDKIWAWQSSTKPQGVSLAGGKVDDQIEYTRSDLIAARAVAWPDVVARGVVRDTTDPTGRTMYVLFDRAMSDDEMRDWHDQINALHPALSTPTTEPQGSFARETLNDVRQAIAAQLSAANARADQARDAALVEAADTLDAQAIDAEAQAKRFRGGSDPWADRTARSRALRNSAAAILALRDKPVPAVTVRAYLLRHRDTGKEEIIDAKKYNPTKLDFWVSPAAMASVEIIPLSAIAGGGDE